jgi:hypothetical protein
MSQVDRLVRRDAIMFDASHWPILLVRYRGVVDDEEFEAHLDRFTTLLGRNQRHAIILDASEAGFTPASHRRLQAQWLRTHRDRVAALNAGIAFVFGSSLFRLVVTSVFMLQPPPIPHRICKTLFEAEQWAAAQLGIETPVGLTWDDEESTKPSVSPVRSS